MLEAERLVVLLAFGVPVACISPFPDGATGTRWALLSICVPVLFCIAPQVRNVTYAVMAYMAASLLWSPDPVAGLDLWWHFALIAMLVAIAPRDMTRIYWAMGLGLAVNSFVVLLQLMGFEPVTYMQIGSGLFFNKNQQNCVVAMVFLALISMDNWKASILASWVVLPLFAVGLSRTAAIALAVAGAFALKGWLRWIALAGGALLLLVLAGWAGRVDSNLQRIDTWLEATEHLSLLGNGLGSFRFAYPVMEHAHNDLLQISYELGFVGALGFVALGLFLIGGTRGAERLILIAFAVEGLFDFPLYQPATAFLAALCAGAVLRRGDWLRRLFAGRERSGDAGKVAHQTA